MRIGIFFSHPTQHFSPLFRALANSGEVDVHVFYYHPGGNYDPGFNCAFNWDIPLLSGYNYTILPPLMKTKNNYILINRHIIKAIKSRRWDAIIISGYSHLNNWIIACYAKISGIPIIYMSDSNLLRPRNLLKKTLKAIVVRAFFKNISAFLACGDHNYAYYQFYGVKQDRIYWCPFPIDITRFVSKVQDYHFRRAELQQRYALPEAANVVIFVGKFVNHKRPLDLVHALQKIGTDKEVIGLFIGDGPLRQAIQEQGGNKVRITGFINQLEMPDHFKLGSVLVLPSEADAHPLVVTEAASLGVPAIISDRCGCYGPHDILRPGENGFIYPCGDVEALTQMLEKLLTDDILRLKYSTRSVELSQTQGLPVATAAIINVVKSLRPFKEKSS